MDILKDILANILKDSFRSKSFYVYVKVFYDIETMFAKLEYAELKLEKLKGKTVNQLLQKLTSTYQQALNCLFII